MTVSIENANASDASEMAAVQVRGLRIAYHGLVPGELMDHSSVQARAKQWQAWLRRRHAHTYLARLDGEFAGFVAVHPAPREEGLERSAEVAALFVAPVHWGQGIAAALVEQILAEAVDDSIGAVVVWVLESNERAKRFYAAQGFKPDGGTRIFSQRPQGPLHDLRYRRRLARRRQRVPPRSQTCEHARESGP